MGRKPKPAWCLPRRRLRLDPRRSNPTACTERPCCAPTRSPQPSFRSVRVRTPTLLVLVPRGQFSCAVLVEPRGCPALGMLPVDRLAMLVKFEEAREDRETSVITQSLSCTITSSALTRSERLACRLPPRSAGPERCQWQRQVIVPGYGARCQAHSQCGSLCPSPAAGYG